MELQDAILKRRSQRKFTDYRVTDEEIRQLLEAARWAPSWANFQVWEFIVVRDRDVIAKVAATYEENNPAVKCTQAASALIVGCAKTGVSGLKGGKQTIFSEWFMFDLGLAVQNLCLKAHELGLGTVVVGSLDHNELKKALLVPDGYQAVVVMPLGKPVVPDKQPTPRKELKDFVHLDAFGRPYA
ncbi:MAG TPA: nitroreductase family protein [Spirochaetota bacterium]|nr:nitroreductase family protein [Spirochaetota bacterium]HOD15941.1 nitroreductase family protein [Spirochaetota bacterium]HPG52741.1 nitroreductase family protein [Spirochaetota bacterium]HPN11349.1 nitroreductase family protein [Spirochaetota bacterium]